MNDQVKKIWEIIKTNETFQEKENRELVQLFMKIDATQVPQELANEIKEILVMLLNQKWSNTEKEEEYLSDILTELRKKN